MQACNKTYGEECIKLFEDVPIKNIAGDYKKCKELVANQFNLNTDRDINDKITDLLLEHEIIWDKDMFKNLLKVLNNMINVEKLS